MYAYVHVYLLMYLGLYVFILFMTTIIVKWG